MKDLSRRKFLQKSSLSAAALVTANTIKADVADRSNDRAAQSQYMGGFAGPKLPNVRIAIIGVGARGP